MNTISSTFAKKLGFWIQRTEVGAQKIDSSSLKIFEIVIAFFSIDNRASKPQFFKEILLIANINIDIALEILILILSNAKINFFK